MASICLSVSMPPRSGREGRHRSARYPGCGDAANDRIVSNREEQGIAERDCRSVLSLGAMACRAILRVQEMEVRDLARRKHFRIRPGRPRELLHATPIRTARMATATRVAGVLHRRESSPSFSSIAPGASMPARTARGRGCHVEIRSWRDTTIPATMPNRDLRDDEPRPVDTLVHDRIDDFEHAVQQT